MLRELMFVVVSLFPSYSALTAGECANVCVAGRAYIDLRNTLGPFDDGLPPLARALISVLPHLTQTQRHVKY